MSVQHDPDNGQYGDCFRTCLACLLDYDNPLDVPHFFEGGIIENDDDGRELWGGVDEWLISQHGLVHVKVPYGTKTVKEFLAHADACLSNVAFTLLGESPRGDWNHVVICRGGEIIHDPSPLYQGGAYLSGPTEDGYFWAEFLVHNTAL